MPDLLLDTIWRIYSARSANFLANCHMLDTVRSDFLDAGQAMLHETSHARNGLPGLRGTDHIGFTVPDLDEAVRFFVEVIGCEPFYELGPFRSDGDWMETHLNVHPRTVMKRLKFLR